MLGSLSLLRAPSHIRKAVRLSTLHSLQSNSPFYIPTASISRVQKLIQEVEREKNQRNVYEHQTSNTPHNSSNNPSNMNSSTNINTSSPNNDTHIKSSSFSPEPEFIPNPDYVPVDYDTAPTPSKLSILRQASIGSSDDPFAKLDPNTNAPIDEELAGIKSVSDIKTNRISTSFPGAFNRDAESRINKEQLHNKILMKQRIEMVENQRLRSLSPNSASNSNINQYRYDGGAQFEDTENPDNVGGSAWVPARRKALKYLVLAIPILVMTSITLYQRCKFI
jgi:hypothetical protein